MKDLIHYGRHFVDEEDVQAVVDVLRHGLLTQGPKVPEFEAAVAARVGARYAVAVSNGTAALHIACAAADVGPGDAVVTSTNTFVASANCAAFLGAIPHFTDIDPLTLNMNAESLAMRCRSLRRVRAVIPVHFAGLPCDMPRIREIASRYGARIIEDAAHALGAVYADGGAVGSCRYSDMTVFSFHPVKAITTGEGGIITTNDEKLYRRLLRLRSHGINKLDDPLLNVAHAYTGPEVNAWYYEMQELGFNYRLTDIQAALGSSQLRKLDRFLSRRRELARRYDGVWSEDANIRPVQVDGRERSGVHLYVLRIAFERLGTSRHQFMRRLRDKGIVTQVHYIPVHHHPYYARRDLTDQQFPEAESYYRQALTIPLSFVLTDAQQARVVEAITGMVA